MYLFTLTFFSRLLTHYYHFRINKIYIYIDENSRQNVVTIAITDKHVKTDYFNTLKFTINL